MLAFDIMEMGRKSMAKKKTKDVARTRVETLFSEAEKRPERGGRYVEIARKVAMKVKMKMPRALKSRFCKHCYAYLRPGVNCRVRVSRGKVVEYCLECKKFRRVPLVKKIKS